MNIIIHRTDGSVSDHVGMLDNISMERHLEQMGYTVFSGAALPIGDFELDAICCRHADDSYDDKEYDVAEEYT
jgi:hypothetical protein